MLIVDDTNIVYEGWGTREARIASVICTRPVYDLPVNEHDLALTRALYNVTPVVNVTVGSLGPTGVYKLPVYRVDPKPGTCP